jgi:peptide/nickel transport system ATP-binding protein
MAGHSRPKDGVASARLYPAIHLQKKGFPPSVMDCRVKPGNDDKGVPWDAAQTNAEESIKFCSRT